MSLSDLFTATMSSVFLSFFFPLSLQQLASPRKGKKKTEELWTATEDLDDECKAKLLALKVLVKIAQIHFGKDPEKVKPIFQLLWKIVIENGEVSPLADSSLTHKLRLRVAAGIHLIDLCLLLNKDSFVPDDLLIELGLLLQVR